MSLIEGAWPITHKVHYTGKEGNPANVPSKFGVAQNHKHTHKLTHTQVCVDNESDNSEMLHDRKLGSSHKKLCIYQKQRFRWKWHWVDVSIINMILIYTCIHTVYIHPAQTSVQNLERQDLQE